MTWPSKPPTTQLGTHISFHINGSVGLMRLLAEIAVFCSHTQLQEQQLKEVNMYMGAVWLADRPSLGQIIFLRRDYNIK